MPRKVNSGLDYDDDYYDYDDDDDDYGYDCEDTDDARGHVSGKASLTENTVDRVTLWQCSICTYDNEESLPYCDVCGVIRASALNTMKNMSVKLPTSDAAEGARKNYEASAMAKSLFTPVADAAPKSSVSIHQLNDESLPKRANQFKFDSPSPDDVVSAGKNASRNIANVTVKPAPPAPAVASTRVSQKKTLRAETTTVPEPSSLSSGTTEYSHASCSPSVPDNGKIETVSSGLQKLGFDKNPPKSDKVHLQRNDISLYKPEKWMFDQEQGALIELNLAIVGHVDSGKSTLSGRLLHLLGRISQKEMHKYEKESKEKGKGSFAYAWAMDESTEERERGITMTVAVAYFNTNRYHIVLLDSPGHKDFVPNMISGATQADAAILVVDASLGSFEAGMEGIGGGQGQTREHAQLVRSFGVEQLVIAVNKMDAVGYSKERFDSIQMQLAAFLRSCQFKESNISWVPASASENQNLVKPSSDNRLSSWYKGPCLLDALNSLQPPERDISKPLRMPICEVFKSHSSGLVAASGKLETGAIRNGIKVLVMPSGELATVRSIERDARACNIARAGDNVSVFLHGIDPINLLSGGVLCHPDFPVAVGTCLELKIYVLDVKTPILIGSQVEFHTHHAKEAARITKISSVIDQKTKKVSKRAPRLLTAKQSAVIEVVLDRAVCVEEFSRCRALGRAFLRASGSTVAVGTISRIVELE